jgi:transcriptional regulator with XRE-family HTH domain
MDNREFGSRIAEARKKNGMTQKELAELLDVTDKAVSKWECGKGFPEITLLPKLSRILGIKPEDLLSDRTASTETRPEIQSGSMNKESIEPQVELVTNVIKYSGEQRRRKMSRLVFPIISASLGLSAFVCLLVDFCITKAFTWSRFPVSSLLFCFVILVPVILLRKHRIALSLAVFFAGLIPFLYYLESLVSAKGWVKGLAAPITGLSAVCTVLIVGLFLYSKIDRLVALAITFAVTGIGLNILINEIVMRYLNEYSFNISVFITAAGFGVVTAVLLITAIARRIATAKVKE